MKIHIIGGSGTGKTYISKRLSEKFNIVHYDLENIFWDNTAKHYGVKTSKEERKEKLNLILENDDLLD